MQSQNEFDLHPNSLFARNLHWTRSVTLNPGGGPLDESRLQLRWPFLVKSTPNFFCSIYVFCACTKQTPNVCLYQADIYCTKRRHIVCYTPSRHLFCDCTKQTPILGSHKADTYSVIAPSRHLFCDCTKQTPILWLHLADTYCVIAPSRHLLCDCTKQKPILWLHQADTYSVITQSRYLFCAQNSTLDIVTVIATVLPGCSMNTHCNMSTCRTCE